MRDQSRGFDRELWQRARPLFDELVELDSGARHSRLDAIGAEDPALRDAVERLLLADRGSEGELSEYQFGSPRSAPPATRSRDPLGVIGQTVSHFHVIDYLAAGGMGVVYTAEDLHLGRTVALKFPLPNQHLDRTVKERFINEARSAAALDHPNLCTIYEVGASEYGVFLAMPLYPGETLKDRIARQGSLPAAEALNIITQVATGLASAHAAGIIHRDLKPANVMLLPGGAVKILDFGLAKIRDISLTKSHATLGTIGYIAPEQIRSGPVDARTDLWAIGVMIYEMLTGRLPFRGEHEISILHAILHEEPPQPSTLNESLSSPFDDLVGALLQKNPGDRYQSAEALLADTAALQRGEALAHRTRFWSRTARRRRARRFMLPISAFAALAVIGGVSWYVYRGNVIPESRATAQEKVPARRNAVIQSIAVLPFDNQLNAPDNEHFSAGLADELTTALGAVPGLKVAGRTSTLALYAKGMDVRAIADRLRVATILEGSVRRDSARLRISARLVQTSDNAVLWSEAFDVPMRDVFTVQEQIARSIADALNVHLTSRVDSPPLVARPTADLEAYDLYLRGRHVRTRPTKDRLEQALAYYRGAIERDPNFAAAYAGLAETYVNLANFGYVTTTEGFGNANIAAERALKLNPRLAEAYTSHGYVLASRRAFDSAEAEFRRALDLNPNFALGRHYYSLLLAMLGRTDEALEQNRRAREIDPLLAPAAAEYGIILCQRDELVAAGKELSRVLTLEPNFALTLYWLGAVRAAEGNNAEAKQLLEHAARASPDYPGVLGSLAYVYARAGRQHAADSIVAGLQARATDDRSRANLAFAYAALGRRDRAFALLRQSEWDVPSMIGLRADPLLRSLRSDPRYAMLVSSIVRPNR